MARIGNAKRVIEQYQSWSFWSLPKDKLRIVDNNKILDCGNQIGYFANFYEDDDNTTYLVLSLQEFKSQPSLAAHRTQLAKAANEAGLPVIFVPAIDYGFGIEKYQTITLSTLLKVAAHSNDDLKTAVGAISSEGDIIAYTYNQILVGGDVLHAEYLLAEFIEKRNLESEVKLIPTEWTMLLEPCTQCLQKMIEVGAENITYSRFHKEKWNTPDYIQLVNDLQSKSICSPSGRPVKLRYV